MTIKQVNTFLVVSESPGVFKLGQEGKKRNLRGGHHWKKMKRKKRHVKR